MKNTKYLVLLTLVLTLVMTLPAAAAEAVDAKPVTIASDVAYSNFLKSEEGIVIACSDNYCLHSAESSEISLFYGLSKDEQNSYEFLKDDYDWSFEITSNAKFVRAEFYSVEYIQYDDQHRMIPLDKPKVELIGSSSDFNNNIVEIDRYHEGILVDRFILFLEHQGLTYMVTFEGTGA